MDSLQTEPPGKPCVCLDICMSQNMSLPLDTVAFTLICKIALFNWLKEKQALKNKTILNARDTELYGLMCAC